MFKLRRPDDAGDSPVIDLLGAAMTFGPWIYDDTTGDPADFLSVPRTPADPYRRGLWYPIGGANNLTSPLLTSVPIAKLFLVRLNVKEIVFHAAYLRAQQRPLIEPSDKDVIDTALLFDYSIKFDLKVPPVEAEGVDVQASVQGLGFVVPSKADKDFWPFSIVLLKDGKKEVAIGDPSLWKIPVLDKILAITKIQLRNKKSLFLVFDFGVVKGFKFLKVDKFRIAWAIAGEGDSGIEVYPSAVTRDIPGAVKAQGFFDIKDDVDGNKSIKGALDLTIIPIKLRVRVFCRIETLQDKDGNEQIAIVVSGDVTFPGSIPIACGLSLKGLGLLYAANFERAERANTGGFSPALTWLQDADGDVVCSVAPVGDDGLGKKNLWRKAFDRSAFGVGVTLVAQPSETIYNINGMFLLELPGPRFLIVAKVSFITKVKSTQEQGKEKELTQGILGMIDLDFRNQKYTLAAFASFQFVKLLELKIPVEASFSSKHGNDWHFFLGTFARPVSGVVDLSFAKLSVTLYFMLAGKEIQGIQNYSGRLENHPGFAIALGVDASLRLGGSSLFIEVAVWMRLLASFGNGFVFIGVIGARGRLHLFIVDVSAEAHFDFFHQNKIEGESETKAGGDVCGSIRIWFVKLKGCVNVGPKPTPAAATTLDDLVSGVHLQSGAPILLQGQGIVDPIDAMLERAVPTSEGWTLGPDQQIVPPEGELETRPRVVPIDVLIVVQNRQTPATNGSGFLATLGAAGPNIRFRTGEVDAEYLVKSIRVIEDPQGAADDLLARTPSPPATWWRKTKADLRNSPQPVDLALLNRTPIASPSALTNSPEQLDLIADTHSEVCKEVAPPAPLVYDFVRQTKIEVPDEGYLLDGVVCDDGKWRSLGADSQLRLTVPSSFETFDDRPEFFEESTIIDTGVRRAELVALDPDRDDARGLHLWTVPVEREDPTSREIFTVVRLVTDEVGETNDKRIIRFLMALSSPQIESDARFVQAEYDANQKLVHSASVPTSNFVLNPSPGKLNSDFVGECELWRRSLDSLLELFASERFQDWTPAILTVEVKKETRIVEIGIADGTFSSQNELASPPQMLLGAIKYLRASEQLRQTNDSDWIDDIRDQLDEYLSNLNASPFLLTPDKSCQANNESQRVYQAWILTANLV